MSMNTTSEHRGPWTPLEVSASRFPHVHATGETFTSSDPATGQLVANLATSTLTDIDDAVDTARTAFNRSAWARDGALRARVLFRYATALRADEDRIAELLTREQGKTIGEARGEVRASAGMIEYYAGLARTVEGRVQALGENVHAVVLRVPVGVVGVITPWNWPLTLLVRSLAPALAAGNAVIVKPASLTAAVSVAALEPLVDQDELPAGIVTTVLGSGGTVGDALVGHPDIDMIAFTGETFTGVQVMKRAADGLHKVALELGGKSANLVFADADLDKALAGAENAIFTTCGQICTAGSRLLVERSIHDEFIARLAEKARLINCGDGLDPSTRLGPLVSRQQRQEVLGYIEVGKQEGTLVVGGGPPADGDLAEGHFVVPTIFTDLPDESRLVKEEIFGPVLAVQTFEDDDEALAMANDSEYGLAAGLWTSNLNRAWRIGSRIEAGTIWINTYHHFYPEAEVGGFKRSGIGRQQGIEGLHEFTETKHLNFDGSPTLW